MCTTITGRIHNKLNKTNKNIIVLFGLFLVYIIWAIDFISSSYLSLSLLYIIPIYIVTLYNSYLSGIIFSILCSTSWLYNYIHDINVKHEHTYIYYATNFIAKSSVFIIIIVLINNQRKLTEKLVELTRIDTLTGAITLGYFNDLLGNEIKRSKRYGSVFSIAYIDIDNFKLVNDKFGHSFGDTVLSTFVNVIKGTIRETDVIARVGGDEFIILLPETDEDKSYAILTEILDCFTEEMDKISCHFATLSIGVLTCRESLSSPIELKNIADSIMYSVKRKGKNAIELSTYREGKS
ncbi:membrane hypothetical protein [Gammaproteobacteria bacterium]